MGWASLKLSRPVPPVLEEKGIEKGTGVIRVLLLGSAIFTVIVFQGSALTEITEEMQGEHACTDTFFIVAARPLTTRMQPLPSKIHGCVSAKETSANAHR